MYQPSPLPISKLSATGNDFLLVGLKDQNAQDAWRVICGKHPIKDVARRLCDRHEGIGADGLLLLKKQAGYDFAWDFYNQDGSSAEMCGNAARCAGLWAARDTGEWRRFRFLTASGPVDVERESNGLISVTMPELKILNSHLELNLPKEKKRGTHIDSGVPHFVIETKSLQLSDTVEMQARFIRSHTKFGSAGTNVTYFQPLKEGVIKAMTFERGVEDFTLACGTGAVAAAAAAYSEAVGAKEKRISVQVPGGLLQVVLGAKTPRLIGPAHWIADLQIHAHEIGVFA